MRLSSFKRNIQEHFDGIAPRRRSWKTKNAYYYEAQTAFFRFLISPGKKVLELGCGTGELLAALEPEYGVGIDLSHNMIELATERFPGLDFRHGDAEDPATWGIEGTFDYIVMADIVGYLEDVQMTFENLHSFCTPSTKIILSYYNFLWGPVLNLAERFSLKTPTRVNNWLTSEDLENLLYLADFEAIKKEKSFLFPKKIPFFHYFFKFFGSLPGVNRLCLCNYVVAKTKDRLNIRSDTSVSVIIPCKNEKGNIEPTIRRLPKIGFHTEIIFVDGHSTDGTRDEIKRAMESFPDKDIMRLHRTKENSSTAAVSSIPWRTKPCCFSTYWGINFSVSSLLGF
jgi:SAM-dependent methyltransferase